MSDWFMFKYNFKYSQRYESSVFVMCQILNTRRLVFNNLLAKGRFQNQSNKFCFDDGIAYEYFTLWILTSTVVLNITLQWVCLFLNKFVAYLQPFSFNDKVSIIYKTSEVEWRVLVI